MTSSDSVAEGFCLPGQSWVKIEAKGLLDRLAPAMDPYRPEPVAAAVAPILSIRVNSAGRPAAELLNRAGDGWRTAHGDARTTVVVGGHGCSLPDERGTIDVDEAFPVRPLMSIVRPALQVSLAARGTAVLHASSVVMDGKAILVAGWSESGKTETALALVEDGARFLSDKWTMLLSDGRAGAFPIGVGVRRWVLPYLPRLRSSLPIGARLQLGIAGMAALVTTPVRARPPAGRLGVAGAIARRAVELGDRAGLTPSEIRAAYDDRQPVVSSPIGLVAVLRNVTGSPVGIDEGDPARLASRLAVSAATEREPYMALLRRKAYSEGEGLDLGELIRRDADLIESALRRVRVIEVTAPFPTDPRVVAREIAGQL